MIAKLIGVALLMAILSSCQTHDYEIRVFVDRDTEAVNGYVLIDGVKHQIRGGYDN